MTHSKHWFNLIGRIYTNYPDVKDICTLFVQDMEFLLRVRNVFNIWFAGILEQSMRARDRVGIGSYRPARLHRPAESIPGIDSWAPLKFKNTVSCL